jgi:hypothetical protein
MNLYEVTFHLESSRDLHVLMAAPTADEAKRQAHAVLGESCEPKNVGDVMKYNWRFTEIDVKEVRLIEQAVA